MATVQWVYTHVSCVFIKMYNSVQKNNQINYHHLNHDISSGHKVIRIHQSAELRGISSWAVRKRRTLIFVIWWPRYVRESSRQMLYVTIITVKMHIFNSKNSVTGLNCLPTNYSSKTIALKVHAPLVSACVALFILSNNCVYYFQTTMTTETPQMTLIKSWHTTWGS